MCANYQHVISKSLDECKCAQRNVSGGKSYVYFKTVLDKAIGRVF